MLVADSGGSRVQSTGWASAPGGCATTPVARTGRASGTGDCFPDRAISHGSVRWRLPRRKRSTFRTASRSRCRDSLLAHLFLLARPAECKFAWAHPDYAGFPVTHKAALEHARLFSEVIYGAPLLYNLLLARPFP